jgi:hypothetical protein
VAEDGGRVAVDARRFAMFLLGIVLGGLVAGGWALAVVIQSGR